MNPTGQNTSIPEHLSMGPCESFVNFCGEIFRNDCGILSHCSVRRWPFQPVSLAAGQWRRASNRSRGSLDGAPLAQSWP
jgi:hypothetical protein